MIFTDLFVLDLANNHQGSVDHAKAIIDSFHGAGLGYTSIKLQMRDLPALIHPDHRDTRQSRRFLDTALEEEEFYEVASYIKKMGFLLSVTPFDEVSVRGAMDLQPDFLKVASCSADDWDLIEEVAGAGLPVIFSTGGLDISEVDNLVSFGEHRGLDFAIHHCVSIYPTLHGNMNLGRIREFRERYPDLTIGWSTHEAPGEFHSIATAYALGARMFECHIALETDEYPTNAYSFHRHEFDKWVQGYGYARKMLSKAGSRAKEEEYSNLAPLKRGYYPEGRMIPGNDVQQPKRGPAWILKQAIHEVKAILNIARIALPAEFEVEFSHHYGAMDFRQIGATMIEVINRHYCKKLIIVLPGQHHPCHYHKIKDETFQVLWGALSVNLDGRDHFLVAGDVLTVQPGVWHSFGSQEGCVFEEISTTAIPGDSVYIAKQINDNTDRKTKVRNWGRWEIEEKLG